MNVASPRATGGCLCGAVRFEIHGPLRDVVNCHCGQCRRSHGHYAAYSAAARGDVVVTEGGGIKWYQSSAIARRGFCTQCGSSLFWEPADDDHTAVAAGSLDPPTGLKTVGNIFTDDAGDYYDIADDIENRPGTMRPAKDT